MAPPLFFFVFLVYHLVIYLLRTSQWTDPSPGGVLSSRHVMKHCSEHYYPIFILSSPSQRNVVHAVIFLSNVLTMLQSKYRTRGLFAWERHSTAFGGTSS